MFLFSVSIYIYIYLMFDEKRLLYNVVVNGKSKDGFWQALYNGNDVNISEERDVHKKKP